jgi:succinoglycan biosynthesis transport protein ExoP
MDVFQDYWNLVLRRKWLILSIWALCVAGAIVLCVTLPKSYRSNTLILVESQKIPENYVKAIVGPSIDERVRMIQQQVMSRTLLTKVVEEFNLYSEDVKKDGSEVVTDRLRKKIKVATVGAAGMGGRGIDAFSISFAHEDPTVAMRVTAKLASTFIEENLKVREQLVEGASEFIEQELELAKVRLETQEKSISQFKTRFMGELPEQMDANLHTLDRLQNDMTAASDALQKYSDRLGMVEKAVKEYEATGSATVGVVTGGGPTLSHGRVDPLVVRLKELERQLSTLSAEYKDTYPDIIQVKQEIEKIKGQLANGQGQAEPDTTSQANKALVPSTPTFDPYVKELLRQREEVKIELVSLRERQRRLMAQMKDFEGRVERTPAREQELMILLRDYNNLQENYRSLLDKKLNARVAENLEKRQKGEQFRIIDPANVPMQPETPDQLRIMLIGFLLGGGLGVGLVVVLEQMQPVFRRPEDVEALLGLPLLASIPNFMTAFGVTGRFLPAPALPSPSTTTGPSVGSLQIQGPARQAGEGYEGNGNSLTTFAAWIKGPRTISAAFNREMNLVSKWRPWSVVAEQFRVAATRLSLMQGNRGGTITIVTSAVKGEGKSATVVNLGYVLARDLGKRTLIVDCDLKCPALHTYAGLPAYPGVRNVLSGEFSVDLCLQQMGELPLWVLATGGESDPLVELSKMPKLKAILDDLRHRFDHILLDAPPILPLADMHILSGMADMVGLVIRAGVTRQSVVRKALRTLKPINEPCVILTGLESDVVPYYMSEGYNYSTTAREVSR